MRHGPASAASCTCAFFPSFRVEFMLKEGVTEEVEFSPAHIRGVEVLRDEAESRLLWPMGNPCPAGV